MITQVHYKMDKELHKKLRFEAAESGMTLQGTLIFIVEQYFKTRVASGEIARFTIIDLFSGIGGLRLSFQEAGGQCVFSS